ncbi:hypothetical protein CCAX7_003350 [Capsulimonas corticalis]|uniref:Uncharacterized protein n=1 Tax=Capsulimonas corticalis TaxID=2219043 RepID=A0A402CS75_9BACT|nr:DUF6559 family protein [Capsulimonas corticalis]BDI28284.1 hypothetical protein CCAX7_003350 [Capsulimonas corticalis]
MFGYIRKIKKRKQIWFYLTGLRDLLKQDHLTSQYYTPEQVLETLAKIKRPTILPEYALAIWCNSEEFQRYYANIGQLSEYWTVRGEIADMYCQGNAQFDQRFLTVYKREGGGGGSSESENLKWGSGIWYM